jgi:hypothetical protein
MVLRKLNLQMQKNETGPNSFMIYKNQFKIEVLNIRLKTIKLVKENRKNVPGHWP